MDTSETHTFALIRTSAVAHAVNNDQRRIPLSVSSKSGKTFTLQVPSNPNVAITGVYYLFAMNENGVPIVAKAVRIILEGSSSFIDPSAESLVTSVPKTAPTETPVTFGGIYHERAY